MSTLQMDKLRLGAQKSLVRKRGTEESRMEFKFFRPWCLGGFFCTLSSPLGLGWDLLPATPPPTKAAGPGLLHLGPWKSPKQELGEELLVILSESHLVCIACGALSNRFWLRDPGGGASPSSCSSC